MILKSFPPPVKKPAVVAEVFLFDESSYGIRKRSSEKPQEKAVPEMLPSSKEFAKFEDKLDREMGDIVSILESVKSFNAESLTGKDRKKYLRKHVVELGGIPEKKIQTPFRMLKGMRKAKKIKAKEGKIKLKETGMQKFKKRK